MLKITLFSCFLAASFGLILADVDCSSENINLMDAVHITLYIEILEDVSTIVPANFVEDVKSCKAKYKIPQIDKTIPNQCSAKLNLQAKIKNQAIEINKLLQNCKQNVIGDEDLLKNWNPRQNVKKTTNFVLALLKPKETNSLLSRLIGGIFGLLSLLSDAISIVLNIPKGQPINEDTIANAVENNLDDLKQTITSSTTPITDKLQGTWTCPLTLDDDTCKKINKHIFNINQAIDVSVKSFKKCNVESKRVICR